MFSFTLASLEYTHARGDAPSYPDHPEIPSAAPPDLPEIMLYQLVLQIGTSRSGVSADTGRQLGHSLYALRVPSRVPAIHKISRISSRVCILERRWSAFMPKEPGD